MSDTILSGNFTVYYGAENRQKRIVWSGSATATNTVNELYSALQNLFDELGQMDDGVPMSAQTPTEYTIGIIDAGDKDPWFIDRTTVEHLTGGALKTASWDRVETTNTGIIKITCATNTSIVAGDIGNDITTVAGDSGTLLDVKGTGAGTVLWIRPDSSAAANSFDSSDTLTCNTHTATFTYSGISPFNPVSNGESLWANIYSIGTIETYTHVYVYQNGAMLTAYKGTSDWWGDKTTGASTDHVDLLLNVKELGIETDEGYVTVMARQYSKTYSYYIVDLTSGGRNPIPLQTGKDLDNQTGLRTFTGSSGSGTFDVGNFIYWDDNGTYTWATTTKRAVITAATTGATPVITYYLIGDPITDFSNGENLKEYTGSADGDGDVVAGTPAVAGPAALGTAPTIRHGVSATGDLDSNNGGTFDIDENGTAENYSIVIDCNQNSLANVYEFCKYITRRGETTLDTETDGMNGEYYIGSDYRMTYNTESATLTEGSAVTGGTSGATGTVVYHNTADNIIILRNSRSGTTAFSSGENVTQGGTTITTIAPTAITPIAAAPYGTFAGGKFFCAPGVVLKDYITTEVNNFQLVDDGGTVRVAPTKVNISVGNTLVGDRVAVFRLDGLAGSIQKDRYSGTVQLAGVTTVVIDTGGGITYDEPGKTTGGVLRIVDTSANTEYRLRFTSWTGSTFTLTSTAGLVADATTNTTTIVDAAGAFNTNARVGDLIRNVTAAGYGYITAINSDTNITTTTITGQAVGDTYDINTLPVDIATNDTVYVPFMDLYVTVAGTQTVQVVYQTGQSTVYTRVRARRSIATGNAILPFEQDSTISSTGMSVSVIRTTDTIFIQ